MKSELPAEIVETAEALVVVADLKGFSDFFAQPDSGPFIPQFLKSVFAELNTCFSGGAAGWLKDELNLPPLGTPEHVKFLGDGMLMVWHLGGSNLQKAQVPHLIKLLWLFQDSFPKVIQSISKNIPLLNLPNRIRFGIAGGSVHRFEFKFAKGFEYVGYPINLACRLQNYADELTFLVSARSGARPRLVGFQRVIARKLKGFPNELVYVMKTELSSMNDKRKISHFETPPVHHLDLNVVRELASQVQIPKRSMKQRVKSI